MKIKDRITPVGEEWDFQVRVVENDEDGAEIIREKRRGKNDERRFIIAMAVLAGIGVGLIVTTIIGGVTDYWAAAGPICGAVIGYYFGKNGEEN